MRRCNEMTTNRLSKQAGDLWSRRLYNYSRTFEHSKMNSIIPGTYVDRIFFCFKERFFCKKENKITGNRYLYECVSHSQLMLCLFNSLANDKFLDWSKLKAFAVDKINVT